MFDVECWLLDVLLFHVNLSRLLTRRDCLKGLGVLGSALTAAPTSATAALARGMQSPSRSTKKTAAEITRAVFQTPLVDTHEHLLDEHDRLENAAPPQIPCDDWALVLSQYFNADLLVAGMPKADHDRFLAPGLDPQAKWQLLAPYWPAVKNTGYGQAVRISLRELYGVDELSARTVDKVQAGYAKTRRPGFYRRILQEYGGIESCQVNRLRHGPFKLSDMPDLLMQDISIVGMFAGPGISQFAPPTGIDVKGLSDWHRVIQWWFDQYAPVAVAVKSQNAYSRDIDGKFESMRIFLC